MIQNNQKTVKIKKGLKFAILLLIFFVFGLHIPKASKLVIFLLFYIILIKWNDINKKDFIIQSSLLLMFSFTYYLIIYDYGFIELGNAILNILIIHSCYALGYSINRMNTYNWPYDLMWIILSIVAGFVVFSFLSVYSDFANYNYNLLMNREVIPFWSGGDSINAPVFGIFASLGLCLAPFLFFGKDQSMKKGYSFLITIIVLLLFIGGFYVNFVLQNRSPFVALALSFISSAVVYFFIKRCKLSYKIKTLFLIGIIFSISYYLFVNNIYDYTKFPIAMRFEVLGLKTIRYESWKYMIRAILNYTNISGGRIAYIGGLKYVHNLWLDIAYNAGILPLIFLLIFHANHLKSFIIIVRAKLPLPVTITIITVSISILVGFMVEPVMDASVPYFSATCFLFGLIRRFSYDIKFSEKIKLKTQPL